MSLHIVKTIGHRNLKTAKITQDLLPTGSQGRGRGAMTELLGKDRPSGRGRFRGLQLLAGAAGTHGAVLTAALLPRHFSKGSGTAVEIVISAPY